MSGKTQEKGREVRQSSVVPPAAAIKMGWLARLRGVFRRGDTAPKPRKRTPPPNTYPLH
jgi:hypothetical protein